MNMARRDFLTPYLNLALTRSQSYREKNGTGYVDCQLSYRYDGVDDTNY